MNVITRYPFRIVDTPTLVMPEGSMILKVDSDGVLPYVLAHIDTSHKEITRRFVLVETDVDASKLNFIISSYIATFVHKEKEYSLFHCKK